MHQFSGTLQKMITQLVQPVNYSLKLGDNLIDVNALIGKQITISFLQQIFCLECGKLTKKSYAQGFCYNCMMESPDNSECIIHPQKCEGHLGKGRDIAWEMEHHVKDHIVYLAKSGGIKVGVTRSTQVPTRWIDQGATQALVFAKVPYRKLAGLIEVELKKYISDKTNWQLMLTNQSTEQINLIEESKRLSSFLPDDLKMYWHESYQIQDIVYPVSEFPTQVTNTSLDKTPLIQKTLVGIKGQYFIFEDGQVINLRNHAGYQINLSW